MSARVLLPLYLGIVLMPLVLAGVSGVPPRSFWDEVASGAGMLAYAILLVEFVLSGRFRQVSAKVGMDVTMRAHQVMARTCLVLAMIHPFLYAAPRNPTMAWDATRAETILWEFGAMQGGILAFLLLPAFVLLSIHREALGYRYEVWRALHGIGAIVIAIGIQNHVREAGRYSDVPALAVFWRMLFVVAAATLVTVYVLRPLIKLLRPWRTGVPRLIGERTWALDLHPAGHRGLKYRAGQFAWISVGRFAVSLSDNPFSIASAPGEGERLRFVIKELGDFTSRIGDIPEGTRAYVDGPYGSVTLPGPEVPGVAMIAGGVGIAPMLGLLRQKILDGDERPTVLIYGNRTAAQILDAPLLSEAALRPDCRLIEVLSEPPERWEGRIGTISPDLLKSVFDKREHREWAYLLCGPAPMLDTVEETLAEMGVPAERILSERFTYD